MWFQWVPLQQVWAVTYNKASFLPTALSGFNDNNSHEPCVHIHQAVEDVDIQGVGGVIFLCVYLLLILVSDIYSIIQVILD